MLGAEPNSMMALGVSRSSTMVTVGSNRQWAQALDENPGSCACSAFNLCAHHDGFRLLASYIWHLDLRKGLSEIHVLICPR